MYFNGISTRVILFLEISESRLMYAYIYIHYPSLFYPLSSNNENSSQK